MTDQNDLLLEGDYSNLLNAGDLVIISFVPYAYDTVNNYGSFCGMSLSPKNIKVVKKNYIPSTVMSANPVMRLINRRAETPKKVSKVIVPCKTPPTFDLGF